MATKRVHRLVVLDGKGIVTGILSLNELAANTGNVEGHLVTSRRPEDLPAFWREVGRLLQSSTAEAAG